MDAGMQGMEPSRTLPPAYSNHIIMRVGETSQAFETPAQAFSEGADPEAFYEANLFRAWRDYIKPADHGLPISTAAPTAAPRDRPLSGEHAWLAKVPVCKHCLEQGGRLCPVMNRMHFDHKHETDPEFEAVQAQHRERSIRYANSNRKAYVHKITDATPSGLVLDFVLLGDVFEELRVKTDNSAAMEADLALIGTKDFGYKFGFVQEIVWDAQVKQNARRAANQEYDARKAAKEAAAKAAADQAAAGGGAEDEKVPEHLKCPISWDLFKDPVVASDGHTYSRAEIEVWFAHGSLISPKTGGLLPDTRLVPNHSMRSLVIEWSEAHV